MYDLYLHGQLIETTNDPGLKRKAIAFLFSGGHWSHNDHAAFDEWDFFDGEEVLFYLIGVS